MRVLLTGSTGQVGFELTKLLPQFGAVTAPDRAAMDMRDPDAIHRMLTGLQPDLVVNAAAYTDVECAEDDEHTCRSINEHAPAVLAEYCAAHAAALIQYSTDYVFDGEQCAPYRESDATNPLNVYGDSKLAGERAIQASGAPHIILRCGWIYGDHGRNFVQTVLKLARERDELSVVDDQIGCPTWARSVARATTCIIESCTRDDASISRVFARHGGTYHLSGAGSTSWYELARYILRSDPRRDEQRCRKVKPVSTEAYGARARRPKYSVLSSDKIESTFGVSLPDWKEQLAERLRQPDAGTEHPIRTR